MRSAAADGTLLKPSWPATPVDAYFSAKAGLAGGAGPIGELYATFTAITDYVVGHVIAMDMASDYTLPLVKVPRLSDADYFTWATDTAAAAEGGSEVVVAQGARSVAVSRCGKDDFQVLHAAAEVRCGGEAWGLLGEAAKWVPTSPHRFHSLSATDSGLSVGVSGAPGERVEVRFARRVPGAGPAEVHSSVCVLPASGAAVASTDGSCA
jgi:hypothetical protein